MKKLLVLMLSLVLCLSLVACSNNDDLNNDNIEGPAVSGNVDNDIIPEVSGEEEVSGEISGDVSGEAIEVVSGEASGEVVSGEIAE